MPDKTHLDTLSGESRLEYLFHCWFDLPIAKLHEIPFGDGGFIAMSVSCALFERLVLAKEQDADRDSVTATMELDPNIRPSRAELLRKMKKGHLDIRVVTSYLHELLGENEAPGTDLNDIKAFWKMFRHGIQHLALPKPAISLDSQESITTTYSWLLKEPLERVLTCENVGDLRILVVDPWRFADMVLAVWRKNLRYLESASDTSLPLLI